MTNNKKAARAGTPTASNTAFGRHNHTKNDLLIVWFYLAKPSRNRQQMRGWQKGAR